MRRRSDITAEQARAKWPQGTYELSVEVKGPEPDKRFRSDWRRLPTLDKGMRVYVNHPYEATYFPEVWVEWRHECVSLALEKWRELGDALSPLPENPARYLRREYGPRTGMAMRILNELHSAGKVTMDDVKRAERILAQQDGDE